MKNLTLNFLFFLIPFVLLSQSGNITGTIADENGLYLPGATVSIESLSKGAITDFDGKFTLIDVPAGTYTLKVSYLGYANVEKEVIVKSKETLEVFIFIESKSMELDAIEVTAYGLSGQSKALNTQKNNLNITNVVSTDQIGKFPDANIGDAVKRIPGITMQVDQGEARNIIVRGLSPQLNSVTLNGSRIPSAEGDNRNIQMDLIPADMIQTIEVSKAVTPDMDADALGGSVNLITRTSPQGFRISTTLGSGVNVIANKPIWNGSFLIGDRSSNGKFGWLLSTSLNDNDFGSDNIEAEWTDEFEYYTGVDDADGEPILEEVDVNPYTNVFEQREYLVQRVRRSFSANMDYKFDANNSIFLKTMYNWRDDRENRFRLEYQILDPEDIEFDDFTITNGVPSRFPAEVARQSKGGLDNNRNKNRRLEDQRMQNYTLGGNHLWGSLKVDWMTSFAKASEERLNERYAQFESEYSIINNLDSRFPRFSATNPNDAVALNNFEFGEITEENQYTEEEDFNVFVNFEVPSDIFGKGDGFIKFGARGRFKSKLRENDFFEFDLEDDFPTLADVPVKDYSDAGYLAGGQYLIGSFASEEWLGALNLVNGEAIPDEFLRANFDVQENVFAGYAMTNQKLSDKLSVLLGLRLEATNITATGNQIEDEENVIGEITQESSYANLLPGVHFKYDISNQTVLRLAWTNTLARPNYADLVPSLDVVFGDEEIFAGNPDLEATTSMNFDVMAEHYFRSVGIVSGGLFYKNIDNFIYTFQGETTDDFYGAGTTGFEIFQPLNGDGATVFGMEFAFQRQLDFLPGFARNFSVYLNYTYLTSTAEGIRNEDGEERTDLGLPNTAPNMFNGSLAYADKKFSARLSLNFSDSYIDEIGGSAFDDRYYDTQLFLDFNTSYQFNKNLSLYASVNNITDQPLRYFQGSKDRTMQAEFYGQRITFGLKYDLFKK